MSYALFEKFENGNYVSQKNLKLVENFISGNLNGWSPNKCYYYTQWNHLTKLYDVCSRRKKNGFRPIAKKGEAIFGGELVNFFAYQKHKNCGCAFSF